MGLSNTFSCVVLSCLVLTACSTSPTGRSQLNLFGNSLDQQGVAVTTIKQDADSTNTGRAGGTMHCRFYVAH